MPRGIQHFWLIYLILSNNTQELTPCRFEFKCDTKPMWKYFLSAHRFEPRSLRWTTNPFAKSAMTLLFRLWILRHSLRKKQRDQPYTCSMVLIVPTPSVLSVVSWNIHYLKIWQHLKVTKVKKKYCDADVGKFLVTKFEFDSFGGRLSWAWGQFNNFYCEVVLNLMQI
jgi:hypothetical protein